MKRRLMTLLFVLGVLLAGASAGLWISGRFGVNHISIVFGKTAQMTGFTHRIELSSGAWLLAWEGSRIEYDIDPQSLDARIPQPSEFSITSWIPGRFDVPRRSGAPLWERLGFTFEFGGMSSGTNPRVGSYVLAAPLWFALIIGLLIAMFTGRTLWRTRARRQRAMLGQCLSCGYDLRGATHERCPECGETVALAPGGAV